MPIRYLNQELQVWARAGMQDPGRDPLLPVTVINRRFRMQIKDSYPYRKLERMEAKQLNLFEHNGKR